MKLYLKLSFLLFALFFVAINIARFFLPVRVNLDPPWLIVLSIFVCANIVVAGFIFLYLVVKNKI